MTTRRLLMLLFVGTSARAQGIASSAIEGHVRIPGGLAADSAVIVVTSEADGRSWRTVTGSDGRYTIENLPAGGPYRIEARRVGFTPAIENGLRAPLGSRTVADLSLMPTTTTLDSVVVEGRRTGLANAARTGPSHTVPDSSLTRLPVLNHDVLALVRESPNASLVVGELVLGAQNPRYNSYQIDGGENNSLYGAFSSTPGGLTTLLSPAGGGGIRSVPLDAIREVEVLVAPFDVRDGDFAGGLINAVTKTGSNTLHGSVTASLQDRRLVGHDLDGNSTADFTTWQLDGSIGGPIVRDRLHFFVAGELQLSRTPDPGPHIGSDTTNGADSAGVGVTRASADRFASILRQQYGVEAGDYGPLDAHNPQQSLLANLTAQVGSNHWFELSENIVHGSVSRIFFDRTPYINYDFSSRDVPLTSTTNGTRLNWTSSYGSRTANELVLAYLHIRDACVVPLYSAVSVAADSSHLAAGARSSCPESGTPQTALELTDNLTLRRGSHRFVVGTHDELLQFRDGVIANAYGSWEFSSLDSLAAGHADSYFRTVPNSLRPEGPQADLRVLQLGVYGEDQWSPSAGLVVIGGLRVDLPDFLDTPGHNAALLSGPLALETAQKPMARPIWSPRLGFNYRSVGRDTTVIRGGIGLFTGRPPYYLPAGAYLYTGLNLSDLDCRDSLVPPFTLDPANQPSACRNGGASGIPQVAVMDRHFTFPQNLKVALGLDHALPWRVLGSLDVLYTRTVSQIYLRDLNRLTPTSTLGGEGGRVLYGVVDTATGEATPARRDANFGPVVQMESQGGDWSVQVTAAVHRRFARGIAFDASYTWTRAVDRMSQYGWGPPQSSLASTPVDGTLQSLPLATSPLEVPHRVWVSGSINLPWHSYVSLIYEGQSGTPYSYSVEGDVNADGIGHSILGEGANDLFYVPRSADDITLPSASAWDSLSSFIQGEPCLRDQRGQIMKRNTCRNPWLGALNLRLATSLQPRRGRAATLTVDVFNLPALLHTGWGLVRRTSDFGVQGISLVQLEGMDVARSRGIYELIPVERNHVDVEASRWRMQLGVRLDL